MTADPYAGLMARIDALLSEPPVVVFVANLSVGHVTVKGTRRARWGLTLTDPLHRRVATGRLTADERAWLRERCAKRHAAAQRVGVGLASMVMEEGH